MIIIHRVDLLAQLFQFELRLGFAVRMVEEMHPLPDNTAEALPKTLILSFQCGKSLLFLKRELDGFLEEHPTQRPYLLGQSHEWLIVFSLTARLDLPAVG